MSLTVALIGAPSALGAPAAGPELGPAAIRAAGLVARLEALGVTVEDFGDVPINVSGMGGVPELRGTEVLAARVRDQVHLALDAELFPIVLGGEHCVAWGTIAGAAKIQPDLGVIWLDAHPDFNTLASSMTGNPHGMVLSTAAGLGPEAAMKRLGRIPLAPPNRIVVLGARSIDPPERDLLEEHGVRWWTTEEVRGDPRAVAGEATDHLRREGVGGVHLSVDVDVLDALRWPGVSTPAGDGLLLDELLTVVQALIDGLDVLSLDVVELHPERDLDGRTTEAAVQVIETAAKALLAQNG